MGSLDRPATPINPLSMRSARRRAGENRWSASNVFALDNVVGRHRSMTWIRLGQNIQE